MVKKVKCYNCRNEYPSPKMFKQHIREKKSFTHQEKWVWMCDGCYKNDKPEPVKYPFEKEKKKPEITPRRWPR